MTGMNMVLIRVAVVALRSKPHATTNKVEIGPAQDVRAVTCANLWHIPPRPSGRVRSGLKFGKDRPIPLAGARRRR
jgi:hypothetical protein